MAQWRKNIGSIDDSPQRYEVFMVADRYGNLITDSKSSTIDAFGRQRVSSPHTLFDSQHRYGLNGKYSTQVNALQGATGFTGATGVGTSYIVHSTNESAVEMHIGTRSNDWVIRESKNVFYYQPGKSLLCMESFTFNEPKTGLRQRIGYFGHQNGIYFENDGSANYFVLRSFSGGVLGSTGPVGTVVESRIPQYDWNVDKFDGTGDSLTNIDVTKANIMFVDIEWLGVGDVRVGFIVNGSMRVVHIFNNVNVNSSTYMTTACLPTRHEIMNTATTSSPSMTRQICNTVISEGGYDPKGTSYSATRGIVGYQTLNGSGTSTPTVSIRLNSSYLDQIAVLNELAVLLESNTNLQYRLLLNATINPTTWNTSASGRIDYNIDATSVSGGTELLAGFVTSEVSTISLLSTAIQLGRTVVDTSKSITGVSDVLTIALTSFGNGTKVATLLGWTELI